MTNIELNVAQQAARAGGEVVAKYFRDGVTMRHKQSYNLVSDADVEAVVDAAARHGVALEINCQVDRLDLNDVHARLARDKGVPRGASLSTPRHKLAASSCRRRRRAISASARCASARTARPAGTRPPP